MNTTLNQFLINNAVTYLQKYPFEHPQHITIWVFSEVLAAVLVKSKEDVMADLLTEMSRRDKKVKKEEEEK